MNKKRIKIHEQLSSLGSELSGIKISDLREIHGIKVLQPKEMQYIPIVRL